MTLWTVLTKRRRPGKGGPGRNPACGIAAFERAVGRQVATGVAEHSIQALRDPRVVSQWHVADLTLPFPFEAAPTKKENLFDRNTDWDALTDLEHARHRKAGVDAGVRVPSHRGNVVRKKHPALRCCPGQYSSIAGTGESGILNPKNVDGRVATKYSANDVTVEVLVRRQSNHRRSTAPPCHQSLANSSGVEASLALEANDSRALVALPEISLDLGACIEVIREYRVDIL